MCTAHSCFAIISYLSCYRLDGRHTDAEQNLTYLPLVRVPIELFAAFDRLGPVIRGAHIQPRYLIILELYACLLVANREDTGKPTRRRNLLRFDALVCVRAWQAWIEPNASHIVGPTRSPPFVCEYIDGGAATKTARSLNESPKS